jgi:hypothetical protein
MHRCTSDTEEHFSTLNSASIVAHARPLVLGSLVKGYRIDPCYVERQYKSIHLDTNGVKFPRAVAVEWRHVQVEWPT